MQGASQGCQQEQQPCHGYKAARGAYGALADWNVAVQLSSTLQLWSLYENCTDPLDASHVVPGLLTMEHCIAAAKRTGEPGSGSSQAAHPAQTQAHVAAQ